MVASAQRQKSRRGVSSFFRRQKKDDNKEEEPRLRCDPHLTSNSDGVEVAVNNYFLKPGEEKKGSRTSAAPPSTHSSPKKKKLDKEHDTTKGLTILKPDTRMPIETSKSRGKREKRRETSQGSEKASKGLSIIAPDAVEPEKLSSPRKTSKRILIIPSNAPMSQKKNGGQKAKPESRQPSQKETMKVISVDRSSSEGNHSTKEKVPETRGSRRGGEKAKVREKASDRIKKKKSVDEQNKQSVEALDGSRHQTEMIRDLVKKNTFDNSIAKVPSFGSSVPRHKTTLIPSHRRQLSEAGVHHSRDETTSPPTIPGSPTSQGSLTSPGSQRSPKVYRPVHASMSQEDLQLPSDFDDDSDESGIVEEGKSGVKITVFDNEDIDQRRVGVQLLDSNKTINVSGANIEPFLSVILREAIKLSQNIHIENGLLTGPTEDTVPLANPVPMNRSVSFLNKKNSSKSGFKKTVESSTFEPLSGKRESSQSAPKSQEKLSTKTRSREHQPSPEGLAASANTKKKPSPETPGSPTKRAVGSGKYSHRMFLKSSKQAQVRQTDNQTEKSARPESTLEAMKALVGIPASASLLSWTQPLSQASSSGSESDRDSESDSENDSESDMEDAFDAGSEGSPGTGIENDLGSHTQSGTFADDESGAFPGDNSIKGVEGKSTVDMEVVPTLDEKVNPSEELEVVFQNETTTTRVLNEQSDSSTDARTCIGDTDSTVGLVQPFEASIEHGLAEKPESSSSEHVEDDNGIEVSHTVPPPAVQTVLSEQSSTSEGIQSHSLQNSGQDGETKPRKEIVPMDKSRFSLSRLRGRFSSKNKNAELTVWPAKQAQQILGNMVAAIELVLSNEEGYASESSDETPHSGDNMENRTDSSSFLGSDEIPENDSYWEKSTVMNEDSTMATSTIQDLVSWVHLSNGVEVSGMEEAGLEGTECKDPSGVTFVKQDEVVYKYSSEDTEFEPMELQNASIKSQMSEENGFSHTAGEEGSPLMEAFVFYVESTLDQMKGSKRIRGKPIRSTAESSESIHAVSEGFRSIANILGNDGVATGRGTRGTVIPAPTTYHARSATIYEEEDQEWVTETPSDDLARSAFGFISTKMSEEGGGFVKSRVMRGEQN
jgi:hypothetical protein